MHITTTSPFVCQWTSRLLPCPSYCKQCCSGHWGTCEETLLMSWYHITASFLEFCLFWACSPDLSHPTILPQPSQMGRLVGRSIQHRLKSASALSAFTSWVPMCWWVPFHATIACWLKALIGGKHFLSWVIMIHEESQLKVSVPFVTSVCSSFKPTRVGRIANHASQALWWITPTY